MIQAYIFDFDGVLIHTEAWHYQTWQDLAQANNWQFDDKIAKELQGKGRKESLDTLLIYNGLENKYSEEEKNIFADKKQQAYLDLIREVNEKHGTEGAREILEKLQQKGYKLGLASSSRNARILAEKIGVSSFFEVIIDGNANFPSKPAPDIFLDCAAKLGVKPENCCVIEDSLSGIAAAQAAGMQFVQIVENELLEKFTNI